MSTGAKVGLIGGAAALVLVLVVGTLVVLSTGGDDDTTVASGEENGEAGDGGGDEAEDSESDDTAAGSGPGTEVYEGSRNELIELDEPQNDPRLVTIEADGAVTIELRNAEGDQVDSVYSYTAGGRAPYNLRVGDMEITQLDVRSEADSWTITDEPLENAETWDEPDEPMEGSGSDVFFVDWHTSDVEVETEHSGDSNFAIWAYETDGGHSDLLVNEIGEHSSTETLLEGASVLHVNADGDWSLTASP